MNSDLKPLEVTCTSTDCDNGLHCFKATQEMLKNNRDGVCRTCGVELVDWVRLHERDLTDVKHTFEALKLEMIRHHYWHIDIDQRAINHAKRKGKNGIREATFKRIRKSIGSAHPFRDGAQTKKSGNVIFYAQHATGCCCRKCAEYWHGIPSGRDLTEEEIAYFSELCLLYINERLPSLTDNGEKVPRLAQLRDLSV